MRGDPELKLKSQDIVIESTMLTKETIFDKVRYGITLSNVVNLNNLNCINKLLRVTSYVLRFVKGCGIIGDLTKNEIENSRKLWLISEQQLEARERKAEFLSLRDNEMWG